MIGDQKGHRSRVIDRFKYLDVGSNAIHDYELLEVLLFFVNRRSDTKNIAKSILNKFKNINGVLYAPKCELLAIPGVGSRTIFLIRIIKEILIRVGSENIKLENQLSSFSKTIEYCKLCMAGLKTEQLRVLYLNKRNYIISDVVMQTGTVDRVLMDPREIIHRALSVAASAMIIVHNHPSGNHTPSLDDISSTSAIKDIASKLGIKLHDHIIISTDGYTSMREMGILGFVK